jgi:hypothetical protein
VPGGALLGTLLGAAHYDAAGTVRPLPRLADPRIYAILVDGDSTLFGTEGGLSWLDWKQAVDIRARCQAGLKTARGSA